MKRSNIGRDLFLCYSARKFPMLLFYEKDPKGYADHLIHRLSFVIPGNSVLHYINCHPDCASLAPNGDPKLWCGN